MKYYTAIVVCNAQQIQCITKAYVCVASVLKMTYVKARPSVNVRST